MKSKNPTRRMGLAVLTGGLAFVGAVDATELLVDGSLENTTNSSNPLVRLGGTENPGLDGGWTLFSSYLYSSNYAGPAPEGAGLQFLRPYPSGTYGITQSSANLTQWVRLTNGTSLTPAKIDNGDGRFTVSAWFCTYRGDNDNSTLTLSFLDDSEAVVGEPILLGGFDFVAALPEIDNGRYPNAREWGRDLASGTIPAGARTARVSIDAVSLSGAPDGYVDLISLDVVDQGATTPIVSTSDPAPNAVAVGPVVNLSVTLQDRTTAVDPDSIQLFFDGVQVTAPTIEKTGPNTVVRYSAGLLPALSPHTYSIVFGSDATPPVVQTNTFAFTVADYLTLPAGLGSPLGSENAEQPGFNVRVYQVETLYQEDPAPAQINLPASIAFSEAVLEGLAGPNVADLSGAASGNTFAVPGTIDWVNFIGATANFPFDQPFPGIPGTGFSEDSFVHEVETYLRFPAAGYYQMGINNEDQFRLSAATAGQVVLQLTAPTELAIPCVPIATNITQLQFGGSLPLSPLTAPVVYATASGNPDDACSLANDTSLAGKIVLLDRGGELCNSATKAEQAQMAGAVAVLQTTPDDTGFPFRIGDINPNVRIPVLVIAENYGASQLKSYLANGTPVTATLQGDPAPRIAEWDGPKGFGAVDVRFGFAVPEAGIYPMRLISGQGADRANLEWFTIQPDGTLILVNDTNHPDALLAFRARTFSPPPVLNPPTLSDGSVTISWSGTGTLEEATAITGPWIPSPSQTNPQAVQPTGDGKLYRVSQ